MVQHNDTVPRSIEPCIPPWSLNRVPASARVKAGMLSLPGGRSHWVIPYGTWIRVAALRLQLVRGVLLYLLYFIELGQNQWPWVIVKVTSRV